MTVHKFQNRETWLAYKRNTLGASESPAALGESPWKSPYALWMEKTGLAPPDELGEPAEWGLRLEEAICRAVADRTGRKVVVRKDYTVDVHPTIPWLSTTLDARQWCPDYRGPGTLQVKTANAFSDDWREQPPLQYQIQLQHEMAVCGYVWGSLAVLVGGQRLLGPFDYQFRPDLWGKLQTALERFWQRVQEKQPPDVDDSKATAEALARAFPSDDGGAVDLAGDWMDRIAERATLKSDIADREKRIRQIENELKVELESATYGLLPNGQRVSYKTQNRSGYEVGPKSFRVLQFPRKMKGEDDVED